MLKRIEDWNYYELLSVERTASQDELWEAFQAALTTYRDGGGGGYRQVKEAETLRDAKKRKDYDLSLLRHAAYFPPKAPFRKSVGKLEIEDIPPKITLWARLRRFFSRTP
jgi:DnaJ-class molecular chaperone